MYGKAIQTTKPKTNGIITPAIRGSQYDNNSCKTKKYHGAFAGFGVTFGFASSRRGACNIADRKIKKAVIAINATNSGSIKCGQVLTLSTGSETDFCIGFALTTVNNRCVTFTSGAKSTSSGALVSGAFAAGFSSTLTAGAGVSAAGAGVSAAGAGVSAAGAGVSAAGAGVSSIIFTSGSFEITVGSDSPFISAKACSTLMPKAFALASADLCNKCSGMFTISLYKGPEIPPSFLTLQKWTAIKITMINGKKST